MVGIKGKSGVYNHKPHSGKTIRKIAKSRKGQTSNRLGTHHTEKTKKILALKNHKNQIIVHHINGNHQDNCPKNLMRITRSQHMVLHWKQGDILNRR